MKEGTSEIGQYGVEMMNLNTSFALSLVIFTCVPVGLRKVKRRGEWRLAADDANRTRVEDDGVGQGRADETSESAHLNHFA